MTVALLATLVVVGMGVSMLMVSAATQRDNLASRQRANRRYLAQTGISQSILSMVQGGTGALGSKPTPVAWGSGTYRCEVVDSGNKTFTITAYGRAGNSSRALRCVTRETTKNIFHQAMYAGNSSGDPNYAVELGGLLTSADTVTGDIYSGGGIDISGNATVSGVLRASGDITGGTGEEGVKSDPPDLSAMHYEVNHDINVKAEFAAYGYSQTNNNYGGTAYQVPEKYPSHIFRMNPSDRVSDTSLTTKDDFFLEDPYEQVSNSTNPSATDATKITLSGVSGESGVSSNKKVIYIDGNLWIHNKHIYSFAINHNETAGIQLTIVVKGNIYMSDNLLLKNRTKDGLALIAIKDPAVPNSGNVYFGDPVFGTLEKMEAFMYAENNFLDNNLSQAGSSTVNVTGMMSAGNQVLLERDDLLIRPKLNLVFDTRIKDGTLKLPGLPSEGSASMRRSFQVVTEYEVPAGE